MKSTFKTVLAAGLSLLSVSVWAANTPAAAKMPEAQRPNDAEIAKIVTTVNEGEIAMANKALTTSTNEEVKKFAQHMITDHKMNNEKLSALSAKTKMTPVDSTQSLKLKADGEKSLMTLTNMKGKAFDKAYVTDQLNAHKMVLENLKTKFIPAAKNPELKALLEKTAEKVEGHMEHAKSLQATL